MKRLDGDTRESRIAETGGLGENCDWVEPSPVFLGVDGKPRVFVDSLCPPRLAWTSGIKRRGDRVAVTLLIAWVYSGASTHLVPHSSENSETGLLLSQDDPTNASDKSFPSSLLGQHAQSEDW